MVKRSFTFVSLSHNMWGNEMLVRGLSSTSGFSSVNLILFPMKLSLHSFSVIFLSHGVIIRGSVTGGEESSPAETGWHALSDG